jgi:hypothetical protein
VNTARGIRWFSTRYFILPGIYVATIVLTTTLSAKTPGGAYYRIFGICPAVASLGMVFDNAVVLVGAFLLVGTPWWYLVGRIGWDSYDRRHGVLPPTVGAVFALFTCFISTAMTVGAYRGDIHDGAFRNAAIAQYWLVSLLCLGALVSMLFALWAALTPNKRILNY